MPALATRLADAPAADVVAATRDSCAAGHGGGAAVSASATAAASAAAPAPRPGPLPLRALNHVSLCVRDVAKSAAFYSSVLGFVEVRRPACFDFDGSWLFGYGLGLHLIHGEPVARPTVINPRGDHLSFQADDLNEVEVRLAAAGIASTREAVVEAGLRVTQLFFHDPDHNMIEVCDCHILPTVALQDGTVILGGSACAMRTGGGASPAAVAAVPRPCSAAAAAVVAGASPPPAARLASAPPSPAMGGPLAAGLTPHLPLAAGPAVMAAARARGVECECLGDGGGGGGGNGGDDTPGGGDSAGTACDMATDGPASTASGGSGGSGGGST